MDSKSVIDGFSIVVGGDGGDGGDGSNPCMEFVSCAYESFIGTVGAIATIVTIATGCEAKVRWQRGGRLQLQCSLG
jgi:hypothetical protein